MLRLQNRALPSSSSSCFASVLPTFVTPLRGIFSYSSKQDVHDTVLRHNLNLNVLNDEGVPHGKTKIIATVGPSCETPEKVRALLLNGMSVSRHNFSHGDHAEHKRRIDLVRECGKSFTQSHIAVALDTKGPEVRLGMFADKKKHRYEVGERVTVSCDEKDRYNMTHDRLFVDYAALATKLSETPERLLIADGVLDLEVVRRSKKNPASELECVAVSEAQISSRQNVHLPGCVVELPAISEKDLSDLEFAAKENLDFVFASFTRSAKHVEQIREVLRSKGSNANIVAKIENHEGVKNIDSIIAASDGVMVARGDLGVDLAFERVFLAQKQIMAKSNVSGKPVICATQMLESMRANPRPTRAEVADVANAVADGADAVMLSGESASGFFPIESIKTLSKISATAFNYVRHSHRGRDLVTLEASQGTTFHSSTAAAAVLLSHQNSAKAIVTLTKSGQSVRLLRKHSPSCFVVAICDTAEMARKLALVRNVIPLHFEHCDYEHFDSNVSLAIRFLMSPHNAGRGLVLERGDNIVVSCTDEQKYNPGLEMRAKQFQTFVRLHIV